MRKIIKITINILLVSLVTHAQQSWQMINPKSNPPLLSAIDFTQSGVGWILGDNGTIFKSIDEGNNWIRANTGIINFRALAIDVVSDLVAYAAGNDSRYFNGYGRIIKTTDGGISWNIILENNQDMFNQVKFTSEEVGWVIGENGKILRTTDGGNNWITQQSGTGNHLRGIFSISESSAWCVGDSGTILHTSNGGSNWAAQLSPSNNYLFSVWFTSPLNGFISTYEGILITTDGGQVWNWIPIGMGTSCLDLIFTQPEIGYMVADVNTLDYKIYKTVDAGETWEFISNLPIGYPNWVAAFNFDPHNNAYLVGGSDIYQYGLVFKSTDSAENWFDCTNGTNKSLTSIYFISQTIGWVAGTNGLIQKSTNSGLDWIRQKTNINTNLEAIFFVSDSEGWCIGDSGKILQTTDGGEAWMPQVSGTSTNLKSVFFVNETVGWIVGESGTILKTTNRGENWLSQSYSTDLILYDCHFTSTTEGWIVGAGTTSCIILHTSNGGANWVINIPTDPFTSLPKFTVYFSNQDTGWIVGWGYYVSKTTDRGLSWTPVQIQGLTGSFYSMTFTSNEVGWAVGGGGNGTIINTTNGGTSWILSPLGWQIFHSVFFENSNLGWIAGNEGVIYKYADWSTDVDDSKTISQITDYKLEQNYPNPFNPTTTIKYEIRNLSFVVIKVYDVLGKEIESLVNEEKPTGIYTIEFNASKLASGVYFYQIRAGDFIEVKKMVLLR